jgi:hypothetical protein
VECFLIFFLDVEEASSDIRKSRLLHRCECHAAPVAGSPAARSPLKCNPGRSFGLFPPDSVVVVYDELVRVDDRIAVRIGKVRDRVPPGQRPRVIEVLRVPATAPTPNIDGGGVRQRDATSRSKRLLPSICSTSNRRSPTMHLFARYGSASTGDVSTFPTDSA